MEERIADGFMIYASMWDEYEEMYNDDPALAAEYLRALGRYNFYGEEYSGEYREIRYIMKTQMELIDNQRIRYNKAVKGGKGNNVFTDDELRAAIASGKYTSKAELGRAFGVSRQAVAQRMSRLGLELSVAQPIAQANVNHCATIAQGKSTSTNPTNTNTITSTALLAQAMADAEKEIAEDEATSPQLKIGGGKGSISDSLV